MLVQVTKKDIILKYFLENNPSQHVYEIGDLDDFFFSSCKYYAYEDEEGGIRFMALVYKGPELTVLLAFGDRNASDGQKMLSEMSAVLPDSFYAHLTPGLSQGIPEQYQRDSHGVYLKMTLPDIGKTSKTVHIQHGVERLLPHHMQDVLSFYEAAYPGNWFDPVMLETGEMFGLWDASHTQLLAVAGVHVYSPVYHVAALGNIATHPAHRNQGYCKIVTSALLRSLLDAGVKSIGLNVHSHNYAAIKVFFALGFHVAAQQEETMFSKVEVLA